MLICTSFPISVVGCKAKSEGKLVEVDSVTKKETDEAEFCTMLNNVSANLKRITQNPAVIKNAPDSCVLALIDSVSGRIIKTKDEQALKCLDALGKVSDGYVSEYITEKTLKIFYEAFPFLFSYLSSNKNSSLEQFLVDAVSMEISDADDEDEKKTQLNAFVKKQVKDSKLPQEYLSYWKSVILKAKDID